MALVKFPYFNIICFLSHCVVEEGSHQKCVTGWKVKKLFRNGFNERKWSVQIELMQKLRIVDARSKYCYGPLFRFTLGNLEQHFLLFFPEVLKFQIPNYVYSMLKT